MIEARIPTNGAAHGDDDPGNSFAAGDEILIKRNHRWNIYRLKFDGETGNYRNNRNQ